MAKRVKITTETVDSRELLDRIRNSWETPGFKPIITIVKEETELTLAMAVNIKKAIAALNSGDDPIQIEDISELISSYSIILGEITSKNSAFQNICKVAGTQEKILFKVNLRIVPEASQHIDPLGIPGLGNRMKPDLETQKLCRKYSLTG